jgi:hypothetical protein
MLVGGAVIGGMFLIVFPAAAEIPLSKETGRRWGEKCMPTGNAVQCCNAQRNGETACKGLEHGPIRRDCEDAEKVCQSIVRSAEEAKKAAEKKTVQQGIPRLQSPADLEKEIDNAKNDLVKVDEELGKVASKEELEALKKRGSKDAETIARVNTILEGRQRSVIETNPPDWTIVKQKTTDAAAKSEAVQKKLLHCVLAGDVTAPDSKGPPPTNKVAPPTNIDPIVQGKHVVGCKFDIK